MWIVAIPVIIALSVVPVMIRHRNKRLAEHAYARVSDGECDGGGGGDIELAHCDTETVTHDVVEWLVDARERLGMLDEPVIDRVDTGGRVSATRLSFHLKNGRREIWLDGPAFMEPLPRIRHMDWKVADVGIAFTRSAEGVEKAVLETNAKRGD